MLPSDWVTRYGRIGSVAMAAKEGVNSEAEVEKLILQGLKEVTMHEVGHTLGLRHNFKSSALLALEDLHNPEKTREHGLTGSVMDYAPANIAPKGVKHQRPPPVSKIEADIMVLRLNPEQLSGRAHARLAQKTGQRALGSWRRR